MRKLIYCVTITLTNLLIFNGNCSFEKARSCREPNLGCRGADRPGRYKFCQKSLQDSWCGRWGTGQAYCHDEAAITTYPQLWPFTSYCIPQPAKDFDVVLLTYCLAWRSVLVVDIFMIKKYHEHGLDVSLTLPCLLQMWRSGRLPFGRVGFCFRVIVIGPWLISSYNLSGEIWVFVSSF